MPTGVIRKPKPGLSDLGGLTRVFVYETDQFTDDVDFPQRTDIVNGEVSTLNLKTAPQDSVRIVFDVKESEARSDGKGTNTQFNFLHALMGKVAGYTKEKHTSVDSYMGKDLMIVVQRPNGDRLLLGQTFKPMRMTITDTVGKGAEEYVGSDISFFQSDAVDFRPPLLANDVVITSGAIPLYE